MMKTLKPLLLALPLLAACEPLPEDGDPVDQSQNALLFGDIVAPPPVGIYVPPPPPPPPCLSSATCEKSFIIGGKKVRFFGSYALEGGNPNVKLAIVDVHGLFRNAATAFDTMVASAQLAQSKGFRPNATVDTILIAPQFPNQEDNRPADFHHWTDNGWVKGGPAEGTALSSYTVMDDIVSKLSFPGRFPNLTKIIIAGHSAGGQFTHRYAASNVMDGINTPIAMRYVVANPSSYLYLNSARPHFDGSPGFGEPYSIQCAFPDLDIRCPGFSGAPVCQSSFNDWHYGLEELTLYASAQGASALRQRLVARRVALLLGTLDNDPNADELDTSCPGRLQGPHRFARGMNQLRFMNAFFPGHHTVVVQVDNAGHSSQEMFVAPAGGVGTGSALLFGGLF